MGTTPTYALPYPELTDPANVPVDMKELAEATEAVLGGRRSASGTASLALPTAQAANSVAVTFPAGRFTAAPAVTVTRYTAVGWGSNPLFYWASAVAAGGFTLNGISNVTGGAAVIGWIAVSAP
jgi:hypothetical protein